MTYKKKIRFSVMVERYFKANETWESYLTQ